MLYLGEKIWKLVSDKQCKARRQKRSYFEQSILPWKKQFHYTDINYIDIICYGNKYYDPLLLLITIYFWLQQYSLYTIMTIGIYFRCTLTPKIRPDIRSYSCHWRGHMTWGRCNAHYKRHCTLFRKIRDRIL